MCRDCAYTKIPSIYLSRSLLSLLTFYFFIFFLRVTQRRSDANNDILRAKMYESYAQVTVFLPDDFHGVVGRVGHSGRSISCSPAALFLKETDNLRFHDVPDGAEDLVLVRTEKVLHVCVSGQDAPLPRTGRVRRPHV